MHISSTTTILALAATAVAKTIVVDVGEDGIFFSPETVAADVGDIVSFHFYSAVGPHSVVDSEFDDPCKPKTGAFFSGLIDGSADGTGDGNVFEILVKSTDPVWYYCSARQHCKNGMVGVINPPASGAQNISAYASGASKVAAASAPSAPTGGYTAGSSPSSTAASSTAASSTAASSTAPSSSAAAGTTSGSSATSSAAGTTTAAPGSSQTSATNGAASPTSTGAAGRTEVGGVLGLMAGGLMALL